jgi:uncharacterized protein YutE (UPF0331/DUF86 family)
MAFRFGIVHIYWRLDYQAIYRAVTEELAYFDELARQVRSYMRMRRYRETLRPKPPEPLL